MAVWLLIQVTILSSAMATYTTDPKCETSSCQCCEDSQCYENFNCTTGCVDGYFGNKCRTLCPQRCVRCARNFNKNSTCFICESGYYNSDTVHDCSLTTSPCPTKCTDCKSATECTACIDGYYISVSVKDCSTPCQFPCTSCSSPLYCTACEAKYYLDDSGNCNQCRTGCAICTNYNQCTTCEPNFTGSLCDSCVTGKGGVNCDIDCPSTCQTCSSVDQCGQCVGGYYNGISPDGKDAFYSDCRFDCPVSCSACTSSTSCSSCVSQYYTGNACEGCVDGQYGTNCDIVCPSNCLNNVCDRDSGNCPCKSGFTGDKCDQCEDGSYGTDCDLPCPSNCLNGRCGRDDHICTGGCINDNFQDSYCNTCTAGTYSDTCSVACPENCKNDACNKNDGSCLYGCNGSLRGRLCDQCEIGKYGDNCDKDCSGNCYNRDCERNTGKCPSCKDGFHGEYCIDNCSSNCMNGICNQTDGRCSDGCVSGFSGDRCCVNNDNCETCSSNDACIACVQGWHSSRCETQCTGNCSDEGCNKSDGACVGCKGHRYGDHCEKYCSENCVHTNATSRCDSQTGHCIGACVDGLYGSMCDETCSNNCNNKTCNKHDAVCLLGCTGGYSGTTCSELNAGASTALVGIIGGVVGGVAGLAIIAVLVMVIRRRARKDEEGLKPASTISPPELSDNEKAPVREISRKSVKSIRVEEDVDDVDDVVEEEAVVNDAAYINIGDLRKRVELANLETYIADNAHTVLLEDYKLFPRGLIKSYDAAREQENLSKNRYASIYPYDENRVKLFGRSSDYINASYIDGYTKSKAYIACLGPTKSTMDQFRMFWDMVWQERVEKIVVLTKLTENTNMKFEQYWPNANLILTYGSVTVSNLHEQENAEYTVRNFSVAKGDQKRTVSQVHFTAWPDKGVPDHVTSIVEFHNKVKSLRHELNGPVVVHCSAGIGRTGTYIALDILTDEGEDKGSVDIFNCVMALRYQRINMVQTPDQYVYLHKAVAHTLTFDSHPVKSDSFQAVTSNTSPADFQHKVQRLKDTLEEMHKEEVESRRKSMTLSTCNRTGTDIPGNRHRPRLYKYQTMGDQDYINAVYIDSFKRKNHFLAAQTPLPSTVVDFIKLVLQERCPCIVNLEHESMRTKTPLGDYLPPDNQSVTHGQFVLSSTKLISPDTYTLRQLTIKQAAETGAPDTVVHCFQFNGWPAKENVPKDPVTFLRFIKDVKMKSGEVADVDERPILLHCLSGAIKCGLFCAVHNAVEKMENEQEVSIENILRQIMVRRRMAFPNKEQLIFCYKAVCSYLDSFETYSNFDLRL